MDTGPRWFELHGLRGLIAARPEDAPFPATSLPTGDIRDAFGDVPGCQVVDIDDDVIQNRVIECSCETLVAGKKPLELPRHCGRMASTEPFLDHGPGRTQTHKRCCFGIQGTHTVR